MNTFDKKLSEQGLFPLSAEEISTLQVNVGYRCNLRCTHCHVEAFPDRKEEMTLATRSAGRAGVEKIFRYHSKDSGRVLDLGCYTVI